MMTNILSAWIHIYLQKICILNSDHGIKENTIKWLIPIFKICKHFYCCLVSPAQGNQCKTKVRLQEYNWIILIISR